MTGRLDAASQPTGVIDPPAGGARPSGPVPVDADRRIDWRFTLPDPRPGAVAVLGGLDPLLQAALRRAAERLVVDDGTAIDGSFDVVVVRNPSDDQLARAWRLLAPGGHLRAELSRGGARARTPSTLRRAGWDDVALFWHRGGFDDGRVIVRLDDRGAAALVLRRQGGGPGARLAVAAARTGAARWFAGSVAVLARRPAADGPTPARAPSSDEPDPEITVWLTPGFRASRHVIGLGADGRRSQLTTVVKVPRTAGDPVVVHEGTSLERFQASTADPDRAPRVLALRRRDGWPMLIETAVNGRPLDRRRVRSDRDAAIDAGLAWLEAAPRRAATPITADGRWARLLEGPADRLAGASGPRRSERRDLVERSLRLVQPLRDSAVPAVFEHGDFSHPNLILLDDGRLAAVDWEKAEPQGLPAHDLCFFLAYVCTASERSPAAAVGAYRAAFSPPGWARSVLDQHLHQVGVDDRLAAALHVASWLRTTAALVDVPGALDRADPHRWERFLLAAVAEGEAGVRGRAGTTAGTAGR